MNADAKKALGLLKAGELVALPTETVYGLAALASNATAVEKIFRLKERPFFDPLIVHAADLATLKTVVKNFPLWAQILADAFWPGPLTLILPKAPSVNPTITSGLDTVAVRIPRHPMTLEVLRALGEPVAAPSANRFGRTSPTEASHVRAEFGQALHVLDGGSCEAGIESTVVEMDEEREALTIFRPGIVGESELRRALHKNFPQLKIFFQSKDSSPGHLKAHYQPTIPLVVYHHGQCPPATTKKQMRLEIPADPRQAARSLYAEMRRICDAGADEMICEWPHDETHDDWRAIWDRLSRAASRIVSELIL